ncbi:flagellar assembly protein FliW [Peribacillus psychrosaccharolyticus]|uniref:Flagellar assembly factor FliW n=1 Tax=Peribacillus psychrosaccharolyticus TaxID=1407 RepID=A0A974RZ80_PERPY|nr:flagellar assembly protein FliW [Peribacillus psychrosaccharolyticus]MEC2055478.1 flagellar assembly protein FliW [Peribacillus psychrosaccharolyticus]MED3743494.1 flagellar assembly protein FliW [Peribacillus psychrosaccharolyticus]QQS99155.1 flagellar assembly protein FliW [Peribacillus psychrosaccharolyticus]
MNIQTKFHGDTEISNEVIYTFENGMPGFLDETQFVILPLEDTSLLVLQSVTTLEVAFIITSPFEVFPDYNVKLTDEVLTSLQIEAEEEVLVYTILTVREPFAKTTANLQAPIVINNKKRIAKQYITNDTSFSMRQPLIPNQEAK